MWPLPATLPGMEPWPLHAQVWGNQYTKERCECGLQVQIADLLPLLPASGTVVDGGGIGPVIVCPLTLLLPFLRPASREHPMRVSPADLSAHARWRKGVGLRTSLGGSRM